MDILEQARSLFLSALEYQNQGQWKLAEVAYRRALELTPDRPSVLNNLAAVLLILKRYDEAASCCEKLLALDSCNVTGLLNLANCKLGLKHPQAALEILNTALAIKPDYAEALTSLGKALIDLSLYQEALASCDRALTVKPDHIEALNNRCVALLELDRPEHALVDCDRALAIEPSFVRALANRSVALRALGRYEDEARNYERLLVVAPDYDYALGNLFQAMVYACDWSGYDKRVRELKNAVREGKRCSIPFVMIRASDSVSDQLQCARIHAEDKFPATPDPVWNGERYRHDRIRLAYLSADFQEHAVAFLTAGLFENHDRGRFETTAISFKTHATSEMRSRLENAFDHFVDIRTNTDLEIAHLMREHEIDIAVDLMGFTLNSRTGIFALRPAPVQVNYLGYPGTLGADYIDYIIADRFVIPEPHRAGYAEHVVYLPDTYQANDSRRRIAECSLTRAEAGLPEHDFVFCSFNQSYKITPAVFERWMGLLRRVERSILWLVRDNTIIEGNLRREATRQGIAPERLVFAPRVKYADHLARYRLADLFLDTLPFNGGTTASDALWAGLPVLTVPGESFAARMAGSLLHAIGLPELIAPTMDDYEALAVKLATQPATLASIKAKLAHNRETQPLFDTGRFRSHIEAAYTSMWERSQRGEPPVSFAVAPINSEIASNRD